MLHRLRVAFLTASLLSHGAARAQSMGDAAAPPRPQVAPSAAASPPAVPSPPAAATWGVVVILASIATGAALTGYGLTIECSADDHPCHRRAALPIWGGVGVAALGSVVGLRLVKSPSAGSATLVSVGGAF